LTVGSLIRWTSTKRILPLRFPLWTVLVLVRGIRLQRWLFAAGATGALSLAAGILAAPAQAVDGAECALRVETVSGKPGGTLADRVRGVLTRECITSTVSADLGGLRLVFAPDDGSAEVTVASKSVAGAMRRPGDLVISAADSLRKLGVGAKTDGQPVRYSVFAVYDGPTDSVALAQTRLTVVNEWFRAGSSDPIVRDGRIVASVAGNADPGAGLRSAPLAATPDPVRPSFVKPAAAAPSGPSAAASGGAFADDPNAMSPAALDLPTVALAADDVGQGVLTMTLSSNPNEAIGTVPSLGLNAAGDALEGVGSLTTVTVTDTRAGSSGYTVNGQVSDFISTADESLRINGQNLGWLPVFVGSSANPDATSGSQVGAVDGPNVEPAPALAPDAPAGDLGLRGGKTLFSTTAGNTGSLAYTAQLKMTAPTSTVGSTYVATFTLTLL